MPKDTGGHGRIPENKSIAGNINMSRCCKETGREGGDRYAK